MPLTNLLTRPSIMARTATMAVKPKPSKVQGSTAKKRVPASRVSKKAFHKLKSRQSFVFTKSSINVSTYITGASMQAAGSLDLSSVTALFLQLKRRAVHQTWAHQSSKKSKLSVGNQSVINPPSWQGLDSFFG